MTSTKKLIEYESQYLKIKRGLLVTTDALENEAASKDCCQLACRNEWVPPVLRFTKRWGNEFVLEDVRIALHSVRESLGIAMTEFPDFEVI